MALTSKANEMRQNGEDVIVLTVGEPDFDTPQYIKDSAKIAIDQGLTKYTSVDGTIPLKKAIINKFKQENNLDYTMDEVIVSSGCKQSIFNLLQVLIDEGDAFNELLQTRTINNLKALNFFSKVDSEILDIENENKKRRN